jgi:hypothetical protein
MTALTANMKNLVDEVTNTKAPSSIADATTLATGGYTGAWGATGRLAILHEKELVLNKQDTLNIL